MSTAIICGLLLLIGPVQDRIIPGTDGFIEVAVPVTPEQVTLRLTSDNPASVTETRRITLRKGVNRLRFDWSRERVDGSSVHFDLAPTTGRAVIASRTTRKRLPKTIYLEVSSSEATEAVFTTRYRLSGVGWRVDYEAMLPGSQSGSESGGAPDRSTMRLRLSAEITNSSGLDLEGCKCFFEGGEIARLTLKNGERRRIDVLRTEAVPVVKHYIYDTSRFGTTPGVEFEIENKRGGPLGKPFLPAGKIRAFTPDAQGRPALLGEGIFPATPLGEKAKFSTGHARDIVVERKVLSQVNENERRDRWNKVVAHDQHAKIRFKVTSGFDHPVSVTIVERPGAPLEVISCTADFKKKTADTIEITVALEAQKEETVEIEWLRKNLF